MAKGKGSNYVVTSFAGKRALILEIEDLGEFVVSQFSWTYAVNEIPRATCLVAVGRQMRNPRVKAAIHDVGDSMSQMKRATVRLLPGGGWLPGSFSDWGKDPQIIFDGYFVGPGLQTVTGKMQAVLHLVHWAIDLTGSSTLSRFQHPTNPSMLVMEAALLGEGGPADADIPGSGAQALPQNISQLVGAEKIMARLPDDLWSAYKTLLCDLAGGDRFMLQDEGAGLREALTGLRATSAEMRRNERAIRALKRIEGPSSSACTLPYTLSEPLQLQTEGLAAINDSVARVLCEPSIDAYAASDFWSVLLITGSKFGFKFVPLAETALIVPDTPALTSMWRVLTPGEYDVRYYNGTISLPVYAVGIYMDWTSATGIVAPADKVHGEIGDIGGEFGAKTEPGDGILIIESAPDWLRNVDGPLGDVAITSGMSEKKAPGTATTQKKTSANFKPGTENSRALLSKVCDRYAQKRFIDFMLAGRQLTLTGKLRFDIAPGSMIRIERNPEQFLRGIDALATSLYAHVVRVTGNINAEASQASTTFECDYVRSGDTEYDSPRTSSDEHPLFKSTFIGAPLVPAWRFPFG